MLGCLDGVRHTEGDVPAPRKADAVYVVASDVWRRVPVEQVRFSCLRTAEQSTYGWLRRQPAPGFRWEPGAGCFLMSCDYRDGEIRQRRR